MRCMAKYPDLKSFVQANYLDLITDSIQKFVDKNLDSHGFHSINVYSLVPFEVRNPQVMTVKCQEVGLQDIQMKIGVAAEVVQMSLGTKKVESDRKTRWFYVIVKANIDEKLQNPILQDVKEYFNGPFDPVHVLDQFLLPYIYTESLEEMGDDFNMWYCTDAIRQMYEFPAEYALEAMGLSCYEADLPESCLGRMYFREDKATTYFKHPYVGEVKNEGDPIKPGTILISRQRYKGGFGHNLRLTIAHEMVHWYLHKKYFKLLAILDDDSSVLSCEVEPSQISDEMTPAQRAHWFAEWQANALALRIVMPMSLAVDAFHEAREAAQQRPHFSTGGLVEDIVDRVAKLFDVPRYAVKQRARQLDWDLVDGAYIYVDGKYHDPFTFQEGILDQHQTFVIDRAGYEKLYKKSVEFQKLIDSGEDIYLGYVVCKNDPKYIDVDTSLGRTEFKLSRYAEEHAEECCLIFSWKSISYLNEMKDPYEFYGQSYLSKDVSAAAYIEYDYNKDFNDNYQQTPESIAAAVAAYNAALDADKLVKIEMLQNNCESFMDALVYHMDRKKITIDQLVERAELSDTTIKKYRSGESKPPIENAMAICIGLNLPKQYSLDLLERAGYILNDTAQHRAYKMCLDYSDGTLRQWNMILDAWHQPHIPNKRNQKTA